MRSRFSLREGTTAARLLRSPLPLPAWVPHYITGELLLVRGREGFSRDPAPDRGGGGGMGVEKMLRKREKEKTGPSFPPSGVGERG
jgi:hypothetical protein